MTGNAGGNDMVQRAQGLAEELDDAVRRDDWDRVFLIAQELQAVADALSAPSSN